MKKNKIAILGMLGSLFLCSCGGKPETNPKEFQYSDLYQRNESMVEEKTGLNHYFASDGYYSNQTQGHNHFYYEAMVNNGFQPMTYKKDCFQYEDSSLRNERMVSGSKAKATRTFVSPCSGKATVAFNPHLTEANKTSTLQLYYNDQLVETYRIDTKEGIYVEKIFELKENDKLRFVLDNDGEIDLNPSIDFTGEKEQLLHQFVDGEYGDVHPFYDEENNRMIMYYLSTGREQNSTVEQFTTLATASNDLIHYDSIELKRDPVTPPSLTTYYALGVYKDAEGIYRSCFGAGNYVGCSKSTDLILWKNGEEPFINESTGMLDFAHRVNFANDVTSGRDPYIYYDEASESYYCIVMNYYSPQIDKGSKGLAIYKGNKQGIYDSENYYRALDVTGRGDPECPQIFKIKNRWYIFYSIYGTGTSGNVGKLAYRIGDENKDPMEVKWDEKEELYLDSGDLHAAQLVQVKDKYYVYGWLTSSPHINSWGGTLNLTKEVILNEDGTLGTRLDPYYKQIVNHGLVQQMINLNQSYQANRSILKAQYTLSNNDSYFYQIESKGNTYYFGTTFVDNKEYLIITQDLFNPLGFLYLELNQPIYDCNLEVYLDEGYVEIFLNDQYSISSHVAFDTQYQIKIQKTANITNVTSNLYKLASSQTVLK